MWEDLYTYPRTEAPQHLKLLLYFSFSCKISPLISLWCRMFSISLLVLTIIWLWPDLQNPPYSWNSPFYPLPLSHPSAIHKFCMELFTNLSSLGWIDREVRNMRNMGRRSSEEIDSGSSCEGGNWWEMEMEKIPSVSSMWWEGEQLHLPHPKLSPSSHHQSSVLTLLLPSPNLAVEREEDDMILMRFEWKWWEIEGGSWKRKWIWWWGQVEGTHHPPLSNVHYVEVGKRQGER